MKVLHTADLHLDRSFEGIKAIPYQISEHLQQANQQTLQKIVDLAIDNQVDSVIFAGDTFHQSRTSIKTQSHFIDEMYRLKEHDITVLMTFGNHDYYVKERYWFDFPDNVILFCSETVETKYFVTKNQEKVAVSGFSYQNPWIKKSKLEEFPVKDQTADIHIGIYHGDANTNKNEQNYAPFYLQDMKEKGYDYWALGHIHQPKIISANPLIVYPGTPQGHTKKETRLRGVATVTIDSDRASIHFESVAMIDWQVEVHSLQNVTYIKDVLQFLLIKLQEKKQEHSIVLKEILLTNTEHLDEEFHTAYESGELLNYLQEQLLRETDYAMYLFQLQMKEAEHKQKVKLTSSAELLYQLEKNYSQPAIFANTMAELVKNPSFAKLIKIDDQWRYRCIEQADEIIMSEFTIQEEQL